MSDNYDGPAMSAQILKLKYRVKWLEALLETRENTDGIAIVELQEENAKLRKVVEAARAITCFRQDPFSSYTSILTKEARALYEALNDLDGEKIPAEFERVFKKNTNEILD